MSTSVEYILDIETQKAQAGLRKTDQQVKRTSASLKNARKQARGLSGSFQFVGEAAGAINPQLAGLADVAMNASSALRGLGRAFASGNPLIIGATALIVSAIAVYTAYTASVRANEESQKRLNEVLKKNTTEMEKQKTSFQNAENAILDSAGSINTLRLRYAELSGSISKAEAAEMKRSFAVEQAGQKLREELQKQISSQEEQLRSAQSSALAIKQRLSFLADAGKLVDAEGFALKETNELYKQQEDIGLQIFKLESGLSSLRTEGAERIEKQNREYAALADKIAAELKKQQEREEAIARAKKRQAQLQQILNNLQSQATSLAERLRDMQIARLAPLDKINAEYQRELDNLSSIEQETIAQFESAEKIAKNKKDQIMLTQILEQKTRALADLESLRAELETQRLQKTITFGSKIALAAGKLVNKSLKGITSTTKTADAALKKISSMIEDANSDQLSALDRINKLEEKRLQTLRDIGAQEGANTEEAEKAIRARAERERAALKKQQTAEAIGVGETVITAVADPTALISALGASFGGIGVAISGVVNALSALGQKDPEQIKEEFKATFEGIAKGLRVIVPLIFELLPPILFDAAQSIVFAIAELPARIGAAIFNAIGTLFKVVLNFFQDPIGAIASGIGKILQDFVSAVLAPILNLVGVDVNSFMSGGRMLLSGQGGLRFTSGNGLAMLHEGEMVVPRSGQISSSVAKDVEASVGGRSINIVINSAVTERAAIDELVRKIEERFSTFGQSTSTLFGGV